MLVLTSTGINHSAKEMILYFMLVHVTAVLNLFPWLTKEKWLAKFCLLESKFTYLVFVPMCYVPESVDKLVHDLYVVTEWWTKLGCKIRPARQFNSKPKRFRRYNAKSQSKCKLSR